MKKYDELLKNVDFYKLHPQYMAFVGDNYEKYKILHIGESHYLNQDRNDDDNKYSLKYFNNWWSDECSELKNDYEEYYNTRGVLKNYLDGDRKKGYTIFRNMLDVFCDVYGVEKNGDTDLYNNFAFMNFFQIPSLYKGISFDNSLKFAPENANKSYVKSFYQKAVVNSSKVVDEVIEILNPTVIVFSSSKSINEYKKYGKFALDKRIVYSVHPGCAWWNRNIKKINNTGKDDLKRQWKEVIEEKI
ncbi:MAG: hypothetical protein DBY14_02865 [Escherichia coli]|nr:MAG: hypothetical protein DBY14_02865 [Escherichia coli]